MKYQRLLVSIIFWCSYVVAQNKILIITCTFNRPDFIALQDKTFKHLLEDEYEFVIFDDARDSAISAETKKVCQQLNLRYFRVPQAIHCSRDAKHSGHKNRNGIPLYIDVHRDNPNNRCADSLQYAWDTLGVNYDGIVFLIDSDMFLTRKFSITKLMQDYDIYGCPQSRGHVNYLWNGLIFLNNPYLPHKQTISFDCGTVDGQGTDVGGQLYCYFKENPNLRIGHYGNCHTTLLPKNHVDLRHDGYTPLEIDFILNNPHRMEFHVKNHFLHYCGGGNWDNKSQASHREKTQQLERFINAIIAAS